MIFDKSLLNNLKKRYQKKKFVNPQKFLPKIDA
jgi:hypothetical protein